VPELPEVETVRAQLAPVLTGRRFERVEIHDRRLVRPYEPAEVAAELEGPDTRVEKDRGKLGELRVTADGQDVYKGNRLLYSRPKTVLAAVRARLGGLGRAL